MSRQRARIYYSEPRVLGPQGSQRGEAGEGARLRRPSLLPCGAPCALTSFRGSSSTLALPLLLLFFFLKKTFVMTTCKHIPAEREQAGARPATRTVPGFENHQAVGPAPAPAPARYCEANPRRCSSCVNWEREVWVFLFVCFKGYLFFL